MVYRIILGNIGRDLLLMAKTSFLLLILLLVCGLLGYLYYDAFSANQHLEARVNEMQVCIYSLNHKPHKQRNFQITTLIMHRNKYEAYVLIRKIQIIG